MLTTLATNPLLLALVLWNAPQCGDVLLQPSVVKDDAEFGFAVALDGDVALIGARSDSPFIPGLGSLTEAGSAFVFERLGDQWVEVAMLVASDASPNAQFGAVLALDGDFAMVASFQAPEVYAFERIGGVWGETQILQSPDGFNNFGWSIAMEGDRAVIGAPGQDIGGAENAGRAYVFERGPAGWVEVAKLRRGVPIAFDAFGDKVALDGDRIVVGAPGHEDGGFSQAGAAYVYVLTPTGWVQEAELLSQTPTTFHWFGTAVAVDGDVIAVGTMHDPKATVFEKSPGGWTQTAVLKSPTPSPTDEYDVKVEGDIVAIGDYADDTFGTNAGAIHLFRRTIGGWIFLRSVSAGAPVALQNLGHKIDMDGGTLLGACSLGIASPPEHVLLFPDAVKPSVEVVRLGIPPNPDALRPGLSGGPAIDWSWDPWIDHAAFAPDATLDILMMGATAINVVSDVGTLLCDPAGASFVSAVPGTAFSVAIPADCGLIGAGFCAQGAALTPGSAALTNALDVFIGGA